MSMNLSMVSQSITSAMKGVSQATPTQAKPSTQSNSAQSNSAVKSAQANTSAASTSSLPANAQALGLYDKKSITVPTAAPTPPKSATPTATSSSGGFVAGGGDVVVDIKASDSGYNNKIYWSTDNFVTKNYIGIDNQTGSFNLGTFAKGTQISFGIDNGQNQFFKTGGASANFDNFDHTKTTETAEGTQIGFEDLAGGGDRDFNDAIINVRNVATPTGKATPTPIPTPVAAPKDNRSGLADGTNPGQGAGKSNSPNQGTLNPNNVSTASKIATQLYNQTANTSNGRNNFNLIA